MIWDISETVSFAGSASKQMGKLSKKPNKNKYDIKNTILRGGATIKFNELKLEKGGKLS
jgi:hypothetical protein